MIFYVEFTKKLIPFSLFSPRFFIPKFISVAKLFLRGAGTHQSERTLRRGVAGGEARGGTYKTNKDKQGGRRVKNRSFERTYFLNDPRQGRTWALSSANKTDRSDFTE